MTAGATTPLVAFGSLGLLAVIESVVRASLEAAPAQRLLGLCTVALATTLPPAFAGRFAAAITVVAASVVSVALFHALTVAALVAVLAVLYALARDGRPAPRAHAIAVGLSAPFLVLALTHPVPSWLGGRAAHVAARRAGAGGGVRGDCAAGAGHRIVV